jgi:hypothetical protein
MARCDHSSALQLLCLFQHLLLPRLLALLLLLSAAPPRRLYVAYTVFWALGGLLAMQIRFIGGNHLTSHELLSFNMVWLGLQVGNSPGPELSISRPGRWTAGWGTG